ncbi:hypothetical protein BDP27DRAFT_1368414 [Rhodocollybia butyracea]|uniref:Uncharacterized protein n=1 Tax=Rhodocollybia butyracea TaxID=206335 RepID=A0A9P5PJ33_9AGAR|nr:hypothetical protein BDP27DRAFT_1368414 [Rhodocollybia butyracea]
MPSLVLEIFRHAFLRVSSPGSTIVQAPPPDKIEVDLTNVIKFLFVLIVILIIWALVKQLAILRARKVKYSNSLLPEILRALAAERSRKYLEAFLYNVDHLGFPDIPSRTEKKFDEAVAELDAIISGKRNTEKTNKREGVHVDTSD